MGYPRCRIRTVCDEILRRASTRYASFLSFGECILENFLYFQCNVFIKTCQLVVIEFIHKTNARDPCPSTQLTRTNFAPYTLNSYQKEIFTRLPWQHAFPNSG